MELDALVEIAQQVLGRNHLGHHPAREGHHLVVEILDTRLADACAQVLLDRGTVVDVTMAIEGRGGLLLK